MSIHDNSPGAIIDKRDISQHSKSNLQQACSQQLKWTEISLKLGTRQDCLHSSCLFIIVFAVLARAAKQLKEIRQIHIEKGEVKVTLIKIFSYSVMVQLRVLQIFCLWLGPRRTP